MFKVCNCSIVNISFNKITVTLIKANTSLNQLQELFGGDCMLEDNNASCVLIPGSYFTLVHLKEIKTKINLKYYSLVKKYNHRLV